MWAKGQMLSAHGRLIPTYNDRGTVEGGAFGVGFVSDLTNWSNEYRVEAHYENEGTDANMRLLTGAGDSTRSAVVRDITPRDDPWFSVELRDNNEIVAGLWSSQPTPGVDPDLAVMRLPALADYGAAGMIPTLYARTDHHPSDGREFFAKIYTWMQHDGGVIWRQDFDSPGERYWPEREPDTHPGYIEDGALTIGSSAAPVAGRNVITWYAHVAVLAPVLAPWPYPAAVLTATAGAPAISRLSR